MASQDDSTLEANIKEIFSLFDVVKTGSINIGALETAMGCLGRTPTDEDISEVDDGNGNVSEVKFCSLMKRKLNEEEVEEDIYNACKVFDKDGYGILKAGELRQAMTSYDVGLTEKEANDILKDAEITMHGHVDYKDLIEEMMSS